MYLLTPVDSDVNLQLLVSNAHVDPTAAHTDDYYEYTLHPDIDVNGILGQFHTDGSTSVDHMTHPLFNSNHQSQSPPTVTDDVIRRLGIGNAYHTGTQQLYGRLFSYKINTDTTDFDDLVANFENLIRSIHKVIDFRGLRNPAQPTIDRPSRTGWGGGGRR